MKYFVLRNNLVGRVTELLHQPDKYLKLGALRYECHDVEVAGERATDAGQRGDVLQVLVVRELDAAVRDGLHVLERVEAGDVHVHDEQAAVDAEVAEKRARAVVAESAVAEVRAAIEALRDEIERNRRAN